MDNNMRLQFSSSIKGICDINESFSSGLLRVCYTGLNRNGSLISKESIECAIPSMYNCPIVCNYDVESDTIGGHDVCCVRTDSGELRLINLTDGVGVIPAGAQYSWESVEDDSGEHEYFVVQVILWKRSPVYKKIAEDGIVSHSMEITVKDGFTREDGVYVVKDFIFTAFCLLGDGVEPCFESSSLQLFEKNGLHSQFTKMMEELKLCFAQVNTSFEVDIHPQKFLTEGGREQLEQKLELLAKFGLTVDQLGFDIEPMSIEDLEMELKKRIEDDDDDTATDDNAGGENGENGGEQEEKDDNDPEVVDDTHDEENAAFALLAEQIIGGLCDALSQITRTTEWGECNRYYFYDCDVEAHEVYCYDSEDWRLYGFSYSMNGDHVVIDFDSKKRKKFMIVDFDEGDADFSFEKIFHAMVQSSETAAQKACIEEKYNDAQATIAQLNTEIEELRQYQQRVTDEERAAAEDAVFARFGDLNGVEAFDSLRANCSEMSIEDIEEKCFAIRGRVNTKVFSVEKPKQTRLPIDKRNASNEPYGGLFIEFPPAH